MRNINGKYKFSTKILKLKTLIFFAFFTWKTSQVSSGAQGQLGIRSHFATLTVLVPPESPRILQGDFLLTDENKEVELDCVSVGGKPATIVRHSFT